MNVGAVAIPVSGLPSWGLMNSIIGLKSPHGFRYMTVGEYRRPKPIAQARNELVEMFLEDKRLEWLLFVDSDAVLHRQTLNRLLSWNKQIVSALCFLRHTPVLPAAWGKEVRPGKVKIKIQEVKDWLGKHPELMTKGATILKEAPEDALIQSSHVGMHTTLIRRRVLEIMEPPYFVADQESKSGGGEDFYFCRKARQLNFQPFVDLSVISAHQWLHDFAGVDFHAWMYWMAQQEEYTRNASGD